MVESGFGVSVDLSRYFSDERGRVLVWVERRRRVRWLAALLRRRLRLPAPPALLAPQGLLHPDDLLALLRSNDNIRAIPAKDWFSDDDEKNYNMDGDNPGKPIIQNVSNNVACDEADGYNNELEIVKRQALELLDQCTGTPKYTQRSSISPPKSPLGSQTQPADVASSECPEAPPPARRRRVRRRPRRPEASSPSDLTMEQDEPSTVVRNAEPRAAPRPRLVHALT